MTPIQQAINIIESYISYIESNSFLDTVERGKLDVLRLNRSKLKELIPIERRVIEEAYSDGRNDEHKERSGSYPNYNDEKDTSQDFFNPDSPPYPDFVLIEDSPKHKNKFKKLNIILLILVN
jgi:hypothetical protein